MTIAPIPVKKYLSIGLLCAGLVSCSDMLDVEPKSDLDKDRYYQNEYDADAAVLGIYGQVLRFAEQYIVLNEVRADLMEPTVNAGADLLSLSNHTVQASDENPYASPRPFYQIILNCNDVLEGLQAMRAENRITQDQFDQRYSDVGAIRSWIYLQLGIHFGEVPYVTKSIQSIEDVNDPGLFPKLTLPELVDKLVEFTESLPYLEQYPANIALAGNYNGYYMDRTFINKKILLGDLYLWQGSYTQAAGMYKEVMEIGTGNDVYDRYRMSWGGAPFNVIYGKENDIRTINTGNTQSGWRSMFGRPSGDRRELEEWVWIMYFDSEYAPDYPFVRLFASEGAGEYLLKPSKTIMDLWNSETQYNNFEFDARGYLSVNNWDGQHPEIGKYTNIYNAASTPLDKDGKWFLERSGSMHLKYAEATNRDNSIDELSFLARAMVNEGVKAAYTPADFSGDDVTDIQNTLYLSFPYDFDARQGDFPYFRGPWYRTQGLRGRAYLPPKQLPEEVVGRAAEMEWTEDLILDEMAQEAAFEGHRWPQLLRIAMRRNDPSVIADRVYDKMSKSTNPAVSSAAAAARAKLMSGDYFLPFDWEK